MKKGKEKLRKKEMKNLINIHLNLVENVLKKKFNFDDKKMCIFWSKMEGEAIGWSILQLFYRTIKNMPNKKSK